MKADDITVEEVRAFLATKVTAEWHKQLNEAILECIQRGEVSPFKTPEGEIGFIRI